MGAGKSAVGRLIAEQLRFKFIDTDELIERHAGKPINTIFADSGEAAFRAMEREVVKRLAGESKAVISTGGGLVVNPDNLSDLKSHALVVCLWTSPEKVFERVGHQTHRPLLNTSDPMERIRSLLAEREPFYRQADILIATDLRSIREVAQQVMSQFRMVTRPQS